MDEYGPNGDQVRAYLAELPSLSDAARDAAWNATRDAARNAAWAAARNAAWAAARDAARNAAWAAARNAAWAAARNAAWAAAWNAAALVVRDLITSEQFDTITAPMRAAGINFDTKETETHG